MNPEKCENSKKMFAFQTGVEIPTPRASLVCVCLHDIDAMLSALYSWPTVEYPSYAHNVLQPRKNGLRRSKYSVLSILGKLYAYI